MLTIEQTLAEIKSQIAQAERMAQIALGKVASPLSTQSRCEILQELDRYYMAVEVLQDLKIKIMEG